jgi:hypothetical protein
MFYLKSALVHFSGPVVLGDFENIPVEVVRGKIFLGYKRGSVGRVPCPGKGSVRLRRVRIGIFK